MPSARTIGNRLAPARFVLFLILLPVAIVVATKFLSVSESVMAGFDLAAGIFLLSCIPLLNDKPSEMREAARANDANRIVLLVLTIILSLVILVTVAGELTSGEPLTGLGKGLVVATLVLAWFFANVVYALHYAHLFYTGADGGKDMAGLDFPGDRQEPDYSDFLYFSFTLGIALQTSDVCITSPHIRRIVTMHCVAAFIYNLGVLAMAVNILAS